MMPPGFPVPEFESERYETIQNRKRKTHSNKRDTTLPPNKQT